MADPDQPAVSAIVHVIDDDEDLRNSLVFLLETVGVEAFTYPTAATFLDEMDPNEPAVVIVDVRMPGMSGFQLQEALTERDYPAPIIFCSAHGDIPMSVRALQGGAVNFLSKPYEPQHMIDVVHDQLTEATRRFAQHSQRDDVVKRLAELTPRERDVFRLVVEGQSSRNIARELGTSVKTVDVHRARIKAKTHAESLGTLVRDVLQHQVQV